MKSSSSCCSRGFRRRFCACGRDRRISSPTLISLHQRPTAFCTGRQKLCLIFTPASSYGFPASQSRLRSACSNCPRSLSAASVNTPAIDLLRCPRAKIHDVRRVIHPCSRLFGLRVVQKNLPRASGMGRLANANRPTRRFTFFRFVRRS